MQMINITHIFYKNAFKVSKKMKILSLKNLKLGSRPSNYGILSKLFELNLVYLDYIIHQLSYL